MDIVGFIQARLAEVEAAARGSYYEGQRWITEEEGVYCYPADEVVHYADRKTDARHIARWDPARVLREVEAKRLLLAGHEGVHRCDWGEHRGGDYLPCKQTRLLALPDSDHPDYDPDWAPEPATVRR